ncbi:HNH endonuclease family protein [Microbulbifer sp. OS29]|uniref:HNH endonuclease family protein n=1 Tax=Microbulbifer okhotskensis TaxID=2926617 RepID=A0A9X2ERJ6_9GAMM|nr:HNH endonuclease family protein [Microbulbifer okhotskensis]MCO1336506.1 HNH endonuclease family protein [Microbulbifer okhotskensis]
MRLLLPVLLSAALAGCLEVEAKEGRGYDRHEWLPKWSDSDGDCQSTRHELLVQFSLAPVRFTNAKHCTVDTGLWLDPYTGNFYSLASDLDVEHIVPLSWAHEHGGANWTVELKQQFAEDPENLWLVDDGRNQSKGDKGPDEWMPPYEPVQAIYVQRFMAIVEKYGLKFSAEESTQILALLGR